MQRCCCALRSALLRSVLSLRCRTTCLATSAGQPAALRPILSFFACVTVLGLGALPGLAQNPPGAAALAAGLAALEANDATTAKLKFAEVLEEAPYTDAAARAGLKLAYLALREKDEKTAESYFLRVTRDTPSSPEAAEGLQRLGYLAFRDRNPGLALERFDASAAHPAAIPRIAENSRALAGFSLVSSYWRTRDTTFLAKAEKRFAAVQTAALDAGAGARAKIGLGETFLLRGRGSEAQRAYEEALSRESGSAYLTGVARFGVGCSLYQQKLWPEAAVALAAFVESIPGAALADKDRQWKQHRPGYAELSVVSPDKAEGYSGLDVVPRAVYWQAMALRKAGRPAEAARLVEGLLSAFPKLKTGERVRELAALCAKDLEEVAK